VNSSIRNGIWCADNANDTLEMVFIRAPRFEQLGKNVEVIAREGDDPVMIREGNVLAATFHPELSEDTRVHQTFLDMVREG
jgi:5'-phosphate synthase pdxT subunit